MRDRRRGDRTVSCRQRRRCGTGRPRHACPGTRARPGPRGGQRRTRRRGRLRHRPHHPATRAGCGHRSPPPRRSPDDHTPSASGRCTGHRRRRRPRRRRRAGSGDDALRGSARCRVRRGDAAIRLRLRPPCLLRARSGRGGPPLRTAAPLHLADGCRQLFPAARRRVHPPDRPADGGRLRPAMAGDQRGACARSGGSHCGRHRHPRHLERHHPALAGRWRQHAAAGRTVGPAHLRS